MKALNFTCNIITPLFLSGANGKAPELRASSIKGAMRYWWRACHGHLSLEALRKQETEIFGGAGASENDGRRSRLLIRIPNLSNLQQTEELLVPHKHFMRGLAFRTGQEFTIRISWVEDFAHDSQILTEKQIQALFELTCLLGGFGKRVRRGMGSIQIIGINGQPHFPTYSLEYIQGLLTQFSPHFSISNDGIYNANTGNMAYYPWIKQIQIGKAGGKNILRRISDTTHELKQKNPRNYEASLGHASRGRFASPIYVSIMDAAQTPVITTLNTVPDKDAYNSDRTLQDNFKKQILR